MNKPLVIGSSVAVGTLIAIVFVAVLLVATPRGRAIVFAISDPGTVNQAAAMKADYVKHFQLAPKAQ